MRAVIYARYSSDLQRDASIEDQLRQCKARIAAEGWTLGASYTDAAMSGAHRLRPGYQKLLEDARNGAFDVIVAEALDRLSRDQEDVAALYKQLSFSGVTLLTLAEGEINELHVGLKGTMNALYLKDLALKTRRGLDGRVRQGRSGGGLCYGYNVVRELDARRAGPRRTPHQRGRGRHGAPHLRRLCVRLLTAGHCQEAQRRGHARPARPELECHHHPRQLAPRHGAAQQ
jgi:DNA invertase Pin-like site-specific DNA recombinase